MTEKEKLKNMSKREKFEYIWEYYHIHIISGIIILVITFSFLNTLVFNPPADTYAGVVLFNQYMDIAIADEISNEFNNTYIAEDLNQQFNLTSLITTTDDVQVSMANQQKFTLMLATQEIDVLITTKESFEELKNQQIFLNLETVFSKEELSKFNTMEHNISPDGELVDTPYICGIENKGYYMGIVLSTSKIENAKEAFLFMIDKINTF